MKPFVFALMISAASLAPASAQLFGNPNEATQAQQLEAQFNIRINQLEGQIRQLNGQVEQYEARIHKLEEQQKRFQEDVDFRFKDLETAAAKGGASSPAKKSSDAGVAPVQPVPQQPAANPVTIAPQAADANAAAALSAMAAKDKAQTAPPSANPQDAFDLSYGYFLRGDYELAQKGFADFLKNFPQDKNNASALYWLGESQLARKNNKDAADSFLKVYQNHGSSAKASDALFKLGVALKNLGAKAEACGTWGEFNKKYPRASNALKQKVAAEQKAAGC